MMNNHIITNSSEHYIVSTIEKVIPKQWVVRLKKYCPEYSSYDNQTLALTFYYWYKQQNSDNVLINKLWKELAYKCRLNPILYDQIMNRETNLKALDTALKLRRLEINMNPNVKLNRLILCEMRKVIPKMSNMDMLRLWYYNFLRRFGKDRHNELSKKQQALGMNILNRQLFDFLSDSYFSKAEQCKILEELSDVTA